MWTWSTRREVPPTESLRGTPEEHQRMAASGRGSPPGAWNGHMEMCPDHGLWKEGQGAPRGGAGSVLPPRPVPRLSPPRGNGGRHGPPPPLGPGGERTKKG